MPDEVIAIVAVGGGLAVAIIAILTNGIKAMVIQSREISLKNRMLDSGYSPDDIEQVLNCGEGKPGCNKARSQASNRTRVPAQKPIQQHS